MFSSCESPHSWHTHVVISSTSPLFYDWIQIHIHVHGKWGSNGRKCTWLSFKKYMVDIGGPINVSSKPVNNTYGITIAVLSLLLRPSCLAKSTSLHLHQCTSIYAHLKPTMHYQTDYISNLDWHEMHHIPIMSPRGKKSWNGKHR